MAVWVSRPVGLSVRVHLARRAGRSPVSCGRHDRLMTTRRYRGDILTRFVIGADVALRLAHDEAVIPDQHQLLAPTLLRSQLLSLLYQAVRQGTMSRKDADRRLDYVRALRIRLLGDRPPERRLEDRRSARVARHPRRRVHRTDPTPSRRVHHARHRARPCSAGPGDGRRYRSPVLIGRQLPGSIASTR
jgi:hypothetical protein